MHPLPTPPKTSRAGFTVIEIAIVSAIIGILAAIAIPYYRHTKDSSIIATLENDLRIFSQDFQTYKLESGTFPATTFSGSYPTGMEKHMNHAWLLPPAIGGTYSWVYSGNGDPDNEYAYIEITGSSANTLRIDPIRLSEIDDDLDDGNPNTGRVQLSGLSIRYYIEQ